MALPVAVPDDPRPQPFGVTNKMIRRQAAAQMQVWERQVDNWKVAQMAADDLAANHEIVQAEYDEVVTFYDDNLAAAAGSQLKQQLLAESTNLLASLNLPIVLKYARR